MNNQIEGQETIVSKMKILKNKKRMFPIIAGMAVLLTVFCGSGIYNMPENRLNRHLEMANKYLEETNYEQAIVEFDKVIAIDPMSTAAYIGKAEAYVGLNDYDMAIETLEVGYGRALENVDIKKKLVELYIDVVEKGNENADYESELLIYDRLLELAADDERVINGLCECLNFYIAILMDEEKYDKIRELAEKYEFAAVNVDFVSILASIQEIEEYRALVKGILSRIAFSCSEENYDDVFQLMQSEEYEAFLAKIDELPDTYGMETEYGRIGIYKVDSELYGNYMIYYGDYENGQRQGTGVWLGYKNNNNYMAKGTWEGDVPQGEFVVREWSNILDEDVVYRVISGNIQDGLWDGAVLWKFEKTSVEETFPVTFNNGIWVALRIDEEDGNWIVSEDTLERGKEGGTLHIEKEKQSLKVGIVGFITN